MCKCWHTFKQASKWFSNHPSKGVIILPTQTKHCCKGNPQNYHIFAFFDPTPKHRFHFMIPAFPSPFQPPFPSPGLISSTLCLGIDYKVCSCMTCDLSISGNRILSAYQEDKLVKLEVWNDFGVTKKGQWAPTQNRRESIEWGFIMANWVRFHDGKVR